MYDVRWMQREKGKRGMRISYGTNLLQVGNGNSSIQMAGSDDMYAS